MGRARASRTGLALVAGLAVAAVLGWIGPPAAAAPAALGVRSVNAGDYPTIQAAIDDLHDTGGVVEVAAGVHKLPAKLKIHSNITLRGAGMDRTIFKLEKGVDDHMLSNSGLRRGSSNIVIRDLTLRGGPTRRPDCCFGVRLVNVRDVQVVNVAADGFSRDGFYLGARKTFGATNVRISGCRARNNGRNGISIVHGSGNVVQSCRVENNNRSARVGGIVLEPDGGLDVSGNWMLNNVVVGQNVGIHLFAEGRDKATVGGNAVCGNRVSRNRSAGISDINTTANVFVNNVTTKNRAELVLDPSAKVGGQFAAACQPPAASPRARPS